MASKWLRFIFQLPLISGLRVVATVVVLSSSSNVGWRDRVRSRPTGAATAQGGVCLRRRSGGVGCAAQGLEAGQVAQLEQLQRGTATGRDVIDLAGQTELLDRRRAVTATDDGEGLGLGQRLGHDAGAGFEPRVLEHA